MKEPATKRQVLHDHLHEAPRVVRLIGTDSRRWAWGWGTRRTGIPCLMGTVSVWDDEDVLGVEDGNSDTAM